jgi:rhodanese-related sulfurtransferase
MIGQVPHPFVAGLIVLLVGTVVAGCTAAEEPVTGGPRTAAPPPEAGGYRTIDPSRLAAMLGAKDFVLVNVHVPYEGEIDSTDLFIPYDEIADRTDELPEARDGRIVLYCRTGRMSTEAAQTLVELGYTNVYELQGGFEAWQAAGHPLVDGGRGPDH